MIVSTVVDSRGAPSLFRGDVALALAQFWNEDDPDCEYIVHETYHPGRFIVSMYDTSGYHLRDL